MKLRLAISSCPNDTFMFDALIHHRIDTRGLEFELTMCDIEELNKLAQSGNVDICKISYVHSYHYATLKARNCLLALGKEPRHSAYSNQDNNIIDSTNVYSHRRNNSTETKDKYNVENVCYNKN